MVECALYCLGGCYALPKSSECFATWLLGCYYAVTKVFWKYPSSICSDVAECALYCFARWLL